MLGLALDTGATGTLINSAPLVALGYKPGMFIESFWWAHEGAAELAHDHSEVQEMWMRVEDLCVPGGVQQMALAPLD